jgi:AcrR family transcriptional regulator
MATKASGEETSRAMREAAVRLIALHGFHGVNLRQLAEEIGIKAGSLYNHIENKQDLLFVLLRGIMQDLVVGVRQQVQQTQGTLPRLCVFVAAHIDFHTRRKDEVFIGTMELRSLTPEHRQVLIDLRSEYQSILQNLVDTGVQERVFHVPDSHIATFAILNMLNGIAVWFRKDGKFSVEEMQRFYVGLTLNLLGTSPAVQELVRFSPLSAPIPQVAESVTAEAKAPARRRSAKKALA